MKKSHAVILSCVLAAAMLAGCGSEKADTTAEPTAAPADTSASAQEEDLVATYHVYNTTGETITELYLYPAGEEVDAGENYAANGLAPDAMIELTRTAASEEEADAMTYVLEFTTESGMTQKFETLHFEIADISLLSADAAAGATPIQFEAPEQKAEYTITNTTGEAVTGLYLYEVGSTDKGENYAADGMAAEETITLTRTAPAAQVEGITYVLEFTTESGDTQMYESVGFEVVAINLLSVDAAAGATPVQFWTSLRWKRRLSPCRGTRGCTGPRGPAFCCVGRRGPLCWRAVQGASPESRKCRCSSRTVWRLGPITSPA